MHEKAHHEAAKKTVIITRKIQEEYRIAEYLGLKGTFKSSSPPPYFEQGHIQLDQVAQSPVQSDFECVKTCSSVYSEFIFFIKQYF